MAVAGGLPILPSVTQMSPAVWRILGQNPGSYTLQGTNTYLVGKGPSRILIDTGEGKEEYVPHLRAAMEQSACKNITHILLTHYHHDHIGGVQDVLQLVSSRSHHIDVYKSLEFHEEAVHHLPCKDIKDGDVYSVEGATVRAVRTPGHSADHISFFMEEEEAIFSGDCVLGHGTTALTDLSAYMLSLTKLSALNAKRMYPAHGEAIQDVEKKIMDYVTHRKAREEQILSAVSGSSISLERIVKDVYGDSVAPEVIPSAERNTLLVLDKLKREGVIQQTENSEWRLRQPNHHHLSNI